MVRFTSGMSVIVVNNNELPGIIVGQVGFIIDKPTSNTSFNELKDIIQIKTSDPDAVVIDFAANGGIRVLYSQFAEKYIQEYIPE